MLWTAGDGGAASFAPLAGQRSEGGSVTTTGAAAGGFVFFILGIPRQLWLLLLLWPPALALADELLLKRADRRAYGTELKFLRMEFDTKLGMYSPR